MNRSSRVTGIGPISSQQESLSRVVGGGMAPDLAGERHCTEVRSALDMVETSAMYIDIIMKSQHAGNSGVCSNVEAFCRL